MQTCCLARGGVLRNACAEGAAVRRPAARWQQLAYAQAGFVSLV